jgi:hypothetical protein
VTYVAKLDDGSNLPDFIKFNKKTMEIQIFTPLVKDSNQYRIHLKGTTKYYDKASSLI